MRQIAMLAFVLAIGSTEGSPIAGVARQTAQTFTIHGEVETATDANVAQGCASAASAGDGMDAGGSATQGAVAGCAGAAGNTTTHAYDPLGRRIRTTRPAVDGATATTHTRYDLVGDITTSTDARGNGTGFTFDALNRRTDQTDPADGEGAFLTQHWTYDQAGNMIRQRDRRGIESESRFDKENRVLGTSRAGLTFSTLSTTGALTICRLLSDVWVFQSPSARAAQEYVREHLDTLCGPGAWPAAWSAIGDLRPS